MNASGTPSPPALTAAAARAAHLLVDDEPHIFSDSVAATVLGDQAGPLLEYHRINGRHEVLAGAQVMVTTRRRYTEDRLAAAVARGLSQYVLLGAGLDTFDLLVAHGFSPLAHVPQRDTVDPACWDRTDGLRPSALSWVVHARRTPCETLGG